jgi:hypothetical protein
MVTNCADTKYRFAIEIWGSHGGEVVDVGFLGSNALKMEAVCSSETLVPIYKSRRPSSAGFVGLVFLKGLTGPVVEISSYNWYRILFYLGTEIDQFRNIVFIRNTTEWTKSINILIRIPWKSIRQNPSELSKCKVARK